MHLAYNNIGICINNLIRLTNTFEWQISDKPPEKTYLDSQRAFKICSFIVDGIKSISRV